MVENRAVASGSGTQVAVATPPDGTTSILVFYTHSVNPSVLPNLPYDTFKDLVPMMLIGTSPMVTTAHPGRADKRTNIQLGMTSMAPSRKQCHPQ